MLAKLVFRGEIAVQNEREGQNSDKDKVESKHTCQLPCGASLSENIFVRAL